MSWGEGSGGRLLKALEEFPIFGKFQNREDKLEVGSVKRRGIAFPDRLTGYSFPVLI